MKTLIVFVLGLVLGAIGWQWWQRTYPPGSESREHAKASAKELGDDLSDAGIVARIKGKYVMEKDISALAITVECVNGHVTLSGGVGSEELVGRATSIAQQTKGVHSVTSKLEVKKP